MNENKITVSLVARRGGGVRPVMQFHPSLLGDDYSGKRVKVTGTLDKGLKIKNPESVSPEEPGIYTIQHDRRIYLARSLAGASLPDYPTYAAPVQYEREPDGGIRLAPVRFEEHLERVPEKRVRGQAKSAVPEKIETIPTHPAEPVPPAEEPRAHEAPTETMQHPLKKALEELVRALKTTRSQLVQHSILQEGQVLQVHINSGGEVKFEIK